jgi:hypothetical protein
LPAKDRYHDAVARALIKEGWTITRVQVPVEVDNRQLLIDMEAIKGVERLVILIEVKGFENMRSPMAYFADTMGQYILYRTALKMTGVSNPLYLTVPQEAYSGVLAESLPHQVLIDEYVNLIVFDIKAEEIREWIRR